MANTWLAKRGCWARGASFFRTRGQQLTFVQTGTTTTSTRGVEVRPKRSLESSKGASKASRSYQCPWREMLTSQEG